MKLRFLCLMFFYIPLLLFSQNDLPGNSSIKWIEGLSWQQVVDKAKTENKCIFLDCYTTWCGPCKKMDNDVYTDERVGRYLNEKFISVKVQLDKTEHDNLFIKNWYSTASGIQRNYSITAFPTFLFFSPEGKPLHKEVGFKDVEKFITISKDALDPNKQYYAILNNYQPNKLDTAELKGLAYTFQYSGKELSWKLVQEYFARIPKEEWGTKENLRIMGNFASSPEMQKITAEYLKGIPGKRFIESDIRYLILYNKESPQVREVVLNYLESIDSSEIKAFSPLLDIFQKAPTSKKIANKYIYGLSESELYTKSNLFFVGTFTTKPDDRAFFLFYKDGAKIDSITGTKGFSKTIIRNAISNEVIGPFWKEANKTGNAPWRKISRTITRKYSKDLSDEIVINAKVSLYKYQAEKLNKHWKEYLKYNIRKIERFGTDTTIPFIDAMVLNNFAFEGVLKHSTNKKEINSAVNWMEGVLRRGPVDANEIDTYANLLYKAGRRADAIVWEEMAVKIAVEKKDFESSINEFRNNLAKMKEGVPTW